MKPTSFKETNRVLGAGKNKNTGQLAICVCRHPDDDVPTLISRWKLDENEIKRIVETGEIWIGVLGTNQPPIMPTPYNPFDELGFEPLDV